MYLDPESGGKNEQVLIPFQAKSGIKG